MAIHHGQLKQNTLIPRAGPIVGYILVVVVSGCSTPVTDTSANVTVGNQHQQEYEMTAYVVEDSIRAR